MTKKVKFFLGIDGGATKAEAAIINSAGVVLAKTRRQGFMLFSRLLPDQAECLADLTAEVYQQAGLTGSDIQFTVAGMSGVDFPEEHDQQWEDVAKALSFPREKTALVNDGVVALWGATCRKRAVLLQHGTGMSTFYRNELAQEKPFDLFGFTKFDLRRSVIQTVARMIDGREPATPLKTAILDYLDLEAEQYAGAVYRARYLGDERYVTIENLHNTLPVAVAQWEAGDPTATELVNNALEEYLTTVNAMFLRMDSYDADVIYGGGAIKNTSPAFIKELLNRTEKRFMGSTAKFAVLPPSVGAALMAAYHSGEEIEPLFKKTVDFYQVKST